LQAGIKILFRAEVRFHELYGFSLNILDIEPSYTLGELARQREEVIRKLKEDGVFELNKELKLPLVIKNIAVISSETAAGYEDFVNTLKNNPYGYDFEIVIFPALMQGEEAEKDILRALNEIHKVVTDFDVVAIIRGGGSKLDLNVFDSYELAYEISQFPLPVITGLGHTKDVSVVDMIVYSALKTPTAAAEFIINVNRDFELKLNNYATLLMNASKEFIAKQEYMLQLLPEKLISTSKEFMSWHINTIQLKKNEVENALNNFINHKIYYLQQQKQKIYDSINMFSLKQKDKLNSFHDKLSIQSNYLLDKEFIKIESLRQKLDSLKPEKIFKRGYHLITGENGKIITDINDLSVGDTINIYFNKGTADAQIKKLNRNKKK
jgi:exodeoxyribonuclease VII large subunit